MNLFAKLLLAAFLTGICQAQRPYADHYNDDILRECRLPFNQSPIDFNSSTVKEGNETIILLNNYDEVLKCKMIKRERNTLTLVISEEEDVTVVPTITRDLEYVLVDIHFHWPLSEHTIDGNVFKMEMHLVHQITSAGPIYYHPMRQKAVIAVLFEESEDDNPVVDAVIHMLKTNAPHAYLEDRFVKFRDLLPLDLSNIYQYMGSTTTPPCNPSVEWNVIKETSFISTKQLEAFEAVYGNRTVYHNARKVYPTHDRPVYLVPVTLGSANSLKISPLPFCLLFAAMKFAQNKV